MRYTGTVPRLVLARRDSTPAPQHAIVPSTMSLPLDGLRVLELGHIIAGPSAGLVFADLGADVVKIERPGEGDQSRGMPEGTAANFHFLNRNKRSIAIDLKGAA